MLTSGIDALIRYRTAPLVEPAPSG
jgi:hypothetical protein